MAAPHDSVIRPDSYCWRPMVRKTLCSPQGSPPTSPRGRGPGCTSSTPGITWLRVLATIAEYIAQMVSDRGHHVRHFVEDFPEALPAER
jgi:hypothetical protein